MPNKNILKKTGKIFSPFRFFLFLLIIVPSYSQTETNLQVFYNLVDSAVVRIKSDLPANQKQINMVMNLGTEFSLFKNRIIATFSENGVSIKNNDSLLTVNLVIDNAATNYNEIFRKGFLGDFYVTRTINLSGNYLISSNEKLNEFDISANDSVKVDDIKNLETISYPFTKAELPGEPFLPSLLEPVLAIGTAAAAIILFFTIRSK